MPAPTTLNPRPRHGSAKPVDPQASARRVLRVGRVMIVIVSIAFAALIGRVVQLQSHPDPRLAGQVGSQRSARPIPARRGSITDREGRILAATHVAHRLFIDPDIVKDRNTFSERVGYELNYDPVEIELAMAARPDSRYVVVDPRVSADRLAKAEQLKLRGLSSDAYTTREYPYGPLAGQLLGFVGRDGHGLDGLEKSLEHCLAGDDGRLAYTRDARGRALWVEAGDYQPQRDGEHVRLAIDAFIQAVAEKHLAAAVTQFNAKAGQIIVMDPWTGEILAMANYPAFDPAAFNVGDPALRRNRAVTDVFEPGSIFKPFVWAAATEAKKANPTEVMDTTTSGVWRSSQGRRLRDARGHGRITWEQVLTQSSNIGMAIVGERMGAPMLHQTLTDFGFGQTTGSGLPGEVPGVVHPLNKWTHYSVTSIPMGQELSVTGLQITRAFCAIANDGRLLTPSIEAIDRRPDGVRILSRAAAEETRLVLDRTVAEGTGRRAKSKLYAIFGKTGTAQLPNFETGGYWQDRYVSSFMCGAPTNEPRIVVGCFIHEPDRSIAHYGGTVAAPAASKVVEESLLYLGVPTQSLPEVFAHHNVILDD